MAPAAPPGYASVRLGDATVVARAELLDTVRAAVANAGSLYAWAGRQADAAPLQGRAPAYAVTLARDVDVVVRHSRHGGALAPLTGDRFLPPTRAPRELATSLRLRAAGVRSPELLAYVVYRAGPLLRRADVATRRVAASRDLAAAIAARPGDDGWVDATGALLRALAGAGALHPDLNLKNVLVAPGDDGVLAAWALDVDVVRFEAGAGARARVAERNWARLARSLRKWREQRALPVRDDDLARLRRLGAAA